MRVFVALLLGVTSTTSATELRYPPSDLECALWLNYLGTETTNEAIVPFVPIFAKDRRYLGRALASADAAMLDSVLSDDVVELLEASLATGHPPRFFLGIEAVGMLTDLAKWTPSLWAATTARGQLLTEYGLQNSLLERRETLSLKILAGVAVSGVFTVAGVVATMFVPGLAESAPKLANYGAYGFFAALPLAGLFWQWSRWRGRRQREQSIQHAMLRADALRARGSRHSAALDILEMVDGQLPFSANFRFGATTTPNVVAGNVLNPETGFVEPFVLILPGSGE